MSRDMTLRQFAAHLAGVAAGEPVRRTAGLAAAGKVVADEARREIGTYQGAIGPKQAWPELAPRTKADRRGKGFPENEPLLRTGELRGSIGHRNDSMTMLVGSDLDIALWQEMGTRPKRGHPGIPPRSFLGGALLRRKDEAVGLVCAAVLAPLAGRR